MTYRPPEQARLGGGRQRGKPTFNGVTAPEEQKHVSVPLEKPHPHPKDRTMTEFHHSHSQSNAQANASASASCNGATYDYHGHYGHYGHDYAPHYGYHGHPHHCGPKVHHFHEEATYPVRASAVPGTELTKDVLRIGGDAYDLSSAVLGSADFRYRFLGWLSELLQSDRNLQHAISEITAPAEAAYAREIASQQESQDAAIKAVTHAVQCAYYENGALVFPTLENTCGKNNRILIPPVNGISYDATSNVLTIGMASVAIPVNSIVAAGLQYAMNNAVRTFPAPRDPRDIDKVFVGVDDSCNAARVASIGMLSEAILNDGIPELCEKDKLARVEKPSLLLAFGQKCREFGKTSIADLLLQLNKSIPLAPAGKRPPELRGFAAAGSDVEERYPVKIYSNGYTQNQGALAVAGDAGAAADAPPITTNKVSIAAPETGLYAISGFVNGQVIASTDASISSGHVWAVAILETKDVALCADGNHCYFDVANTKCEMTSNVSAVVPLEAGQVVSIYVRVSGGGLIRTTSGCNGVLTLQRLSTYSIDFV